LTGRADKHYDPCPMPKRTFQPHAKPRKTTHGFRKRMRSQGGRNVIKRRRRKGRAVLSV